MHSTAEPTPNAVLAWHFVGDKLRDGRPVPADGVLLRHDGPVALCESGLHGSVRAIDALSYAPACTVCRVRVAVDIQRGGDKLVARERTIFWRLDATDVLCAFARQCALDVSHMWDMPDVVRRYLETGDEILRDVARDAAGSAARAAARDAARAAVRAAAWAAAGSAVRAAAWAAAAGSAAWAAARDAAWAAVRAAAMDAAWAAAGAAAMDAAWAAAGSAVRDAARDAARDAQNTRLESAIYAAAGRIPEEDR